MGGESQEKGGRGHGWLEEKRERGKRGHKIKR